MATANPFDLLGDDDNDDPSHLIAAQQQKIVPKKAVSPTTQAPQAQQPKPAKLPSKPLPPAQAVKEAKTEVGRGGGRGGGRGYGRGRGGGGFNRDPPNENSFSNSGFSGGQGGTEEPDAGKPSERRGGYGGPRGSFRGGRRGGFSNGEDGAGDGGERTRRVFERRSGTGRGNEFKREGAGRGNWGTPTDELAQVTEEVVNEGEKNVASEKPAGEEEATDVNKENPANEAAEEKEPEEKEMTLEEYEKVLEEKRKALLALKTEERKVAVDKELASMQQLSSKKDNNDIFVKLVPGLYNGSSLKSFDDSEPYITNNKLTNGARVPENNLLRSFCADKEKATNVAKIKVVVRKRPLNKKEIAKKEEDIITIDRNSNLLTVHETKLKVDLTEYVEKHEFLFDAVMSEDISNDEIYSETVEPIVPIIFQRTKATCFAYGQTGSGKTYTMQPLPLKASQDIFRLLNHTYRNQGFQLFVSFFEVYGGKVFDLLNDRKKLCMREDGKQQVCIVGLQEYRVSNVETIKELIERGNATRSTGTTGANEEFSRSHAILQLAIKRPVDWCE